MFCVPGKGHRVGHIFLVGRVKGIAHALFRRREKILFPDDGLDFRKRQFMHEIILLYYGALGEGCFGHFNFGHLSLFLISDFVRRIYKWPFVIIPLPFVKHYPFVRSLSRVLPVCYFLDFTA